MTPIRINTVSSIFHKTQVKEYQVPNIRLSGKWILKIGIHPGDKIEVKVMPKGFDEIHIALDGNQKLSNANPHL